MFSLQNHPQKLILSLALALVMLGIGYHNASADGIIIPDPPPGPDPVSLVDSWLSIRYHRVSVRIEDQIAVTRVEQEFLNEQNWEVEGTYIFPIPEGASISEFIMWVDGIPVEGKILPADQARQIYEDIVRERRDPALLEYIGQAAVQARIFPIPPGESRKIELEYSQVLLAENGMVRYLYPLNTEKFSAQPLENCSIQLELISKKPLRSVYSPTHQDRISLERDDDHRVVIGYEESDLLPDQDFELIYTVSEDDIGLDLLTFPDLSASGVNDQEGYFLLMAAPTLEAGQIVPRDIVVVLDSSGSMEGDKLNQAREASKYVLSHLNQEDRFNVIAFSTGINHFANDLQPVSRVSDAAAWINQVQALGGTNINLALLEALSQRTGAIDRELGRPLVILFLTDGLPTEGVTEIDQIIANVGTSATDDVRLFAFGVGDDVNTELLDTLSEENRGLVSYVRPGERIDEEVSALFAKIKTPVLTNLRLDFGGILVEEIYPPVLPDLFSGTQLLVTGRYRLPAAHSGKTVIQLTGTVNSLEKNYQYPVIFGSEPDQIRSNSFIPRLWATRKIGYLLNQIRYQGENKEWVDAIVQLSIRYGIITPYTSFLIEEHNVWIGEGFNNAADELIQAYSGPAAGGEAVDKADAESSLRSAESITSPRLSGGEASDQINQPIMKYVEDKTFLLQDGIWIDSDFDPLVMDTITIGFRSTTYYQLLTAQPSWGKYLALGEQVIFVTAGQAYEIVLGEGELSSLPSNLSQPSPESRSAEANGQPPRAGDQTFCSVPFLIGLAAVGFGNRNARSC